MSVHTCVQHLTITAASVSFMCFPTEYVQAQRERQPLEFPFGQRIAQLGVPSKLDQAEKQLSETKQWRYYITKRARDYEAYSGEDIGRYLSVTRDGTLRINSNNNYVAVIRAVNHDHRHYDVLEWEWWASVSKSRPKDSAKDHPLQVIAVFSRQRRSYEALSFVWATREDDNVEPCYEGETPRGLFDLPVTVKLLRAGTRSPREGEKEGQLLRESVNLHEEYCALRDKLRERAENQELSRECLRVYRLYKDLFSRQGVPPLVAIVVLADMNNTDGLSQGEIGNFSLLRSVSPPNAPR